MSSPLGVRPFIKTFDCVRLSTIKVVVQRAD